MPMRILRVMTSVSPAPMGAATAKPAQ
jgi:hypothetical protein